MGCIVHEVTKSWTQLSNFHVTYKLKLKHTYMNRVCDEFKEVFDIVSKSNLE